MLAQWWAGQSQLFFMGLYQVIGKSSFRGPALGFLGKVVGQRLKADGRLLLTVFTSLAQQAHHFLKVYISLKSPPPPWGEATDTRKPAHSKVFEKSWASWASGPATPWSSTKPIETATPTHLII